MFQIDNATAISALPTPAAAGTAGFFTDGNPVSGVAATVVPADWFNAVQMEIVNIIVAAGFTLNKTEQNQLLTAIRALLSSGGVNSAVDTGTANNILISLPNAPTVLPVGFVVVVKVAATNTGATTAKVNTLSAAPVVLQNGVGFTGGEFLAGSEVFLVWDGTKFWSTVRFVGPIPILPISFISSTSWTVPAGVFFVRAKVWGGGGGGGGQTGSGAGAGGGAGYIERICAVTPGQVIPITIGTGGAAGVGAGAPSNGTFSSFGSFCTANGGFAGQSGNGASAGSPGAGGGTVGAGWLAENGYSGTSALGLGGINFGGAGGGTPFGASYSPNICFGVGIAGLFPGGGGGGSGAGNSTGGIGGAGLITVEY